MTWSNCIVNLNSDSTGSFYTGDIVTGTVILEFEHEQKIENIDFEVIGISKARWSRPMPTMPYIKIYSEKRKVLSIKINNIFCDIISGKKVTPGVYSYPFHFSLPEDLPSTFASSSAKVQYCIKIKSKPIYKLRKTVPFVVLGNVNLNHLEDMLVSSIHDFAKTFRNSGKFSISAKTYTGFAPKQTIPFEITINNEKKAKISKINIILVQKLKYEIQTGYLEDEKIICKIEYNKLGNTMVEICKINIEIPSVTPSSIHIQEPMINISYIFRVEVIFPFHFTLHGDIPVTVATVPVIHCDF